RYDRSTASTWVLEIFIQFPHLSQRYSWEIFCYPGRHDGPAPLATPHHSIFRRNRSARWTFPFPARPDLVDEGGESFSRSSPRSDLPRSIADCNWSASSRRQRSHRRPVDTGRPQRSHTSPLAPASWSTRRPSRTHSRMRATLTPVASLTSSRGAPVRLFR